MCVRSLGTTDRWINQEPKAGYSMIRHLQRVVRGLLCFTLTLVPLALAAVGAQQPASPEALWKKHRNTSARPAVGKQGMISSAHPLATQAGLEILEAGGNRKSFSCRLPMP